MYPWAYDNSALPSGNSTAAARERNRTLTRVLQPAHTIRLRPAPIERQTPGAANAKTWHAVTDRGRVREQNEDSCAILVIDDRLLLVVADGMGGHEAGEVASSVAVAETCAFVREHAGAGDLSVLIADATQAANAAVRNEAAVRGSDMGTTLCAAIIADTAYIANVGDSRAYWIANGAIEQISQDHSLAAKLVESGRLAAAEAATHPASHMLYRSLGAEAHVKAHTAEVKTSSGGVLLLCSDGLWGEVADETILQVCTREHDAKTICRTLVRLANENGGRDNITAAAVRLP